MVFEVVCFSVACEGWDGQNPTSCLCNFAWLLPGLPSSTRIYPLHKPTLANSQLRGAFSSQSQRNAHIKQLHEGGSKQGAEQLSVVAFCCLGLAPALAPVQLAKQPMCMVQFAVTSDQTHKNIYDCVTCLRSMLKPGPPAFRQLPNMLASDQQTEKRATDCRR